MDQNTSHSVSLKPPALPHMQRLFFSPKHKYSNSSHHISWSIGKTSRLLVLTGQNKLSQLVFVNPADPADDFQRGQNPPRVAHIWKLNDTESKPQLLHVFSATCRFRIWRQQSAETLRAPSTHSTSFSSTFLGRICLKHLN